MNPTNPEFILHGIIRKMPDTGIPMLLQPVVRSVQVGTARAELSALTGTWFVFGQKGESTPYLVESESLAVRLALTVDHYNATGERKKFSHRHYKITWKHESNQP
jgi:hypothetical protein